MKLASVSLLVLAAAVSLLVVSCQQAAPAPAPTKASTGASSAAQPTAAPAAKAVTYPEKGKNITMVIPWAAGGTTDTIARLLSDSIGKKLGSQVVVENKPGGSSQVALTELVQTKPDGYTIAASNITSAVLSYIDPKRQAIYTRKNFQPVAQQVYLAFGIAVKSDSPYKTLKDLVDAAKAQPGKIRATATGVRGMNHLMITDLEQQTGAKFAIVQFDGGAPALTALLGGNVDVMFDDPSVFKRSDQVRAIAITDTKVSASLASIFPTVKTAEEQGYKLYMGESFSYSVVAGTPMGIVNTLADAVKATTQEPEYVKKISDLGIDVSYKGPDDLATFWTQREEQLKPLLAKLD